MFVKLPSWVQQLNQIVQHKIPTYFLKFGSFCEAFYSEEGSTVAGVTSIYSDTTCACVSPRVLIINYNLR